MIKNKNKFPIKLTHSNYSFSFKSSRKKRSANQFNLKKSIILQAFNKKFALDLKPVKNSEFLAPNISYRNKNYSLNNFYKNNNCFYIGIVNNDEKSKANINLCQEGHIVRLIFLL